MAHQQQHHLPKVLPRDSSVLASSRRRRHLCVNMYRQRPHGSTHPSPPPPVVSSSSRSIASTTTTTTTTQQPTAPPVIKRTRRKRRRKTLKWNDMIQRLEAFYNETGHSLVPSDYQPDPDLYRWTVQIRRNYRHQALQQQELSSSGLGDSKNGLNGRMVAPPHRSSRRPRLAREKLQRLERLQFSWNARHTRQAQSQAWDKRYQDLVAFQERYGHCRVPANCQEFPGLGVWVRNQRREYRKLVNNSNSNNSSSARSTATTSVASSTLLIDNRLQLLESIGFVWHKPHETAWEMRYQQLLQFCQEHGHAHVPEDYPPNVALGQWCMNQRTAYRRYCLGEPTALTARRIDKLERAGFVWSYRNHVWHRMLDRLQSYHELHGHVDISTSDADRQDLRIWLAAQRYWFHQNKKQQEQQKTAALAVAGGTVLPQQQWEFSTSAAALGTAGSTSMRLTEERIQALEGAIPDFQWKGRQTSGPKAEDWSKLFDAMRAKGIQPNARPKQHWFEGVNPFSIQVKDTWTEQDLLELWNQHDGDDDD